MIDKFVKAWEKGKSDLRKQYEQEIPAGYHQIVEDVIRLIDKNTDSSIHPDPERITQIDEGNYKGTKVFVIGETGYQPSQYWYVRTFYGSCSGCDTVMGLRRKNGSGEPPTEEQVEGFMRLALHCVQKLREMDSDSTF